MKTLWVNAKPYDKDLVTSALESGAEAVVVPDGKSPQVRQLGRIKTVEKDGDIIPGTGVEFMEIASKADEDRAAGVPPGRILVVKLLDWTVIPIENLLARRRGPLLVEVADSRQAALAVEILEKGADGVLLNTTEPGEVKRTAGVLAAVAETLSLAEAEVRTVRQRGMGDRACLDTCTQMEPGEGMLVGNTATAFFLVHSESIENPYVDSRPFRVNAGAVHAYCLCPSGKTRYLADLKAGDEVLVVDYRGKTEVAYLGRNKIEKRPMVLVEALSEGRDVGLVLQNAETIRLVAPGGKAVSIAQLKAGDRVLVHFETGGRHFGMKVDETLTEK
jgi:3-dehydroquinate synthase II